MPPLYGCKKKPAIERFVLYFDRGQNPDDCWLWKGYLGGGYGHILNDNDKEVPAHRFSYEHFIGHITEGFHIHHKCEVKHCINPSHLEMLSPQEHYKTRQRNPYKFKGMKQYLEKRSPVERFMSFVDKNGENGCWNWTANSMNGYGLFKDMNVFNTQLAHRISYEIHKGKIPNYLHIDHLCRNKSCVNPNHLEAVTPQENHRRMVETITHCPHGHEYTEENTSRFRAARQCRTCHREMEAERRERKKNGFVKSA